MAADAENPGLDRARHELRATGVKDQDANPLRSGVHSRGYLPHVKSWKQFTSLRAKPILGLGEGRFWQPESFDHWIRDEEERSRIARYIRHNPVTARLCARPEEWRWSSAWRGDGMPGP